MQTAADGQQRNAGPGSDPGPAGISPEDVQPPVDSLSEIRAGKTRKRLDLERSLENTRGWLRWLEEQGDQLPEHIAGDVEQCVEWFAAASTVSDGETDEWLEDVERTACAQLKVGAKVLLLELERTKEGAKACRRWALNPSFEE